MVFHWNLNESKSSQVSRTFLCILSDLNNAVVWMVSTRPFISKSPTSCTNPLLTVSTAPITVSITVTLMFRIIFSSLARFRFLSLFQISFKFALWSAGTAKSTIRQVLFFLLSIIMILIILFV